MDEPASWARSICETVHQMARRYHDRALAIPTCNAAERNITRLDLEPQEARMSRPKEEITCFGARWKPYQYLRSTRFALIHRVHARRIVILAHSGLPNLQLRCVRVLTFPERNDSGMYVYPHICGAEGILSAWSQQGSTEFDGAGKPGWVLNAGDTDNSNNTISK